MEANDEMDCIRIRIIKIGRNQVGLKLDFPWILDKKSIMYVAMDWNGGIAKVYVLSLSSFLFPFMLPTYLYISACLPGCPSQFYFVVPE